jgi:hypothetical protein
MIKFFLLAVVIMSGICLLTISCGKHIYIMKGKEINRYGKKAKDPDLLSFVEYNNGDTIKGKELREKHNVLNGKDTWLMDGKEIPLENIKSYQDKYGYRRGDFSRIVNGKMSLYLYQVDNSRLVTHYSSPAKAYKTEMQGGTQTTFYIERAGTMETVTFNFLNQVMVDCQPAAKQVDEEFRNTVWKRKPGYPINDYRALIRIINIYNGNCN